MLAQRAMSLLFRKVVSHQGKGRTSVDLEGDKQPPAPDQDLESNWIFQERISVCCIEHGMSM